MVLFPVNVIQAIMDKVVLIAFTISMVVVLVQVQVIHLLVKPVLLVGQVPLTQLLIIVLLVMQIIMEIGVKHAMYIGENFALHATPMENVLHAQMDIIQKIELPTYGIVSITKRVFTLRLTGLIVF